MFKFKFYIPESQKENFHSEFNVISELGKRVGIDFDPSNCLVTCQTYQSLNKFQSKSNDHQDTGYDYLVVGSVYNNNFLVFDVKNENFISIRF